MHPFESRTVNIDHVQFAADGDWEDVQIVRPGENDDIDRLSKWLQDAPDDIAAEILFKDDQGELSGFFGVRTHNTPSDERTDGWMEFAVRALEKPTEPFSELVSGCLPALGFPPTMPTSKMTFEMGVFNFWTSAIPLLLDSSPLETLSERLQDKQSPPWLTKGHEAPICFEYVWHDPTHIWVSQIVSKKREGRHYVDIGHVKKSYLDTCSNAA